MQDSIAAGNQSTFFGQKVSIPGINVNNAGDNQLILKDDYSTRIYYSSDGIPSVILGLRSSTGLRGLYVSGNGIDVTTASDGQLTFNTDKSFTVNINDTYTFPAMTLASFAPPVYAPSIAIPHNAGYTPAVNCYAPLETGGSLPVFPPDFPSNLITFIPNGGLIYQTGLSYHVLYYGVDATNLYLGMSYINDDSSTVVLAPVPITYFVYTSNASSN